MDRIASLRNNAAALAVGLLLLATVVLTAGTRPAAASLTKTWSGQSDFLSGTLTGVDAITSPGNLVLDHVPPGWTKYAGNPILTPGGASWNTTSVATPDVVHDGGIYKMWYQGGGSSAGYIGYATSSDGTRWTPYAANPVLGPSSSGYDLSLGPASVVHDGALYRMWYVGDSSAGFKIMYATSPDGINWTKFGNVPVFNGTMAWDNAAVGTPVVLKVGGTFWMYYSGAASDLIYKIGLATSTDGVRWAEDSSNPVMIPQLSWESTRIHPGSVRPLTSGYEMYYEGGGSIGHAVSPDGRTWIRDTTVPILVRGPSGAWDSSEVGAPCVIPVGAETRMYYTGGNLPTLDIGYAVENTTSTAYVSAGFWASPVFDSGNPNTAWLSLSWVGTTPPGTSLGAVVAVGNTSVTDPTWSVSPPFIVTPASLHLPEARYARVVVALASDSSSQSPMLNSVSLTYETPVPPTTEFWGLGLIGVVLLLCLAVAGAAFFSVLFLLARRSRIRSAPTASPSAVQVQNRRFCPQCGASVAVDQRFCVACGSALVPPGRPPGN